MLEKRYAFICIDDFSRYTWVDFIREIFNAFDVFKKLFVKLKNEKDCNIGKIKSDRGKEFENANFSELYNKHGIAHEFLAPITPKQNGTVERKNRTL